MGFLSDRSRDPDWRAAPLGGRRLMFALTRALAGGGPTERSADAPADDAAARVDAVVARTSRRGRTLEIACLGAVDPVALVAPVAARFGAELVVLHVTSAADPLLRSMLRHGGVVVAGRLEAAAPGALAHAPASPHPIS
jgi:hypothetical protein